MQEFRNKIYGKRYIIWLHVIAGIAVFYFFIHPLTMVIYWFEINEVQVTLKQIFEIAPQRIIDSFSFKMTGMSIAFLLLGAIIGLGSGIYYRLILHNSKILHQQNQQLKMNILSIIEGGENEMVEFKSSLRYDYNNNITNKGLEHVIVKTLVGFLNTKGGKLLIGVDDDGNVLGLKNDFVSLKKKDKDGFELKIYQLISDEIGIGFCSFIQVNFHEIEGDDVCILYVQPSTSPAYKRDKNKTLFYIRVGNSTKPLTIKEAVNYIKEHWA